MLVAESARAVDGLVRVRVSVAVQVVVVLVSYSVIVVIVVRVVSPSVAIVVGALCGTGGIPIIHVCHSVAWVEVVELVTVLVGKPGSEAGEGITGRRFVGGSVVVVCVAEVRSVRVSAGVVIGVGVVACPVAIVVSPLCRVVREHVVCVQISVTVHVVVGVIPDPVAIHVCGLIGIVVMSVGFVPDPISIAVRYQAASSLLIDIQHGIVVVVIVHASIAEAIGICVCWGVCCVHRVGSARLLIGVREAVTIVVIVKLGSVSAV